MKVLGIDAGLALAGWSIIEKDPMAKNGMKLIDYGAIETEASELIEDRLFKLFNNLADIIKEYKPDEMAVESLFYFKNQKTVMNVSQARGVIVLAGRMAGMKVYNYTPLQVKTSVTGYGRAEKKQIQKMVQMIFGLKEAPKPDDVADAIAVGVCHINQIRNPKIEARK